MKHMPLTQGQVALVDDANFDWLSKYKWCANKIRGNFYAVRHSPQKKGNRVTIHMSRQILGLKCGDKHQGDHINHNTLDNQQINLRMCTVQQNQRNRKAQNKTSKYKGVSWCKREKKWRVSMKIKDRYKHLGYFEKEELAALAYDMVAIREHGEFAYLNF